MTKTVPSDEHECTTREQWKTVLMTIFFFLHILHIVCWCHVGCLGEDDTRRFAMFLRNMRTRGHRSVGTLNKCTARKLIVYSWCSKTKCAHKHIRGSCAPAVKLSKKLSMKPSRRTSERVTKTRYSCIQLPLRRNCAVSCADMAP